MEEHISKVVEEFDKLVGLTGGHRVYVKNLFRRALYQIRADERKKIAEWAKIHLDDTLKGRGAFDNDPLEHAKNVIEASKEAVRDFFSHLSEQDKQK